MRACVSAAEIGNFYYGPGHPMKPHRKPPPPRVSVTLRAGIRPEPSRAAQTASGSCCRRGDGLAVWPRGSSGHICASASASASDCGCVRVAAGIRMCHNLLLNYRLYEKMDVFVRPRPLSAPCSSAPHRPAACWPSARVRFEAHTSLHMFPPDVSADLQSVLPPQPPSYVRKRTIKPKPAAAATGDRARHDEIPRR